MFTCELLQKNSTPVPTFPEARRGARALFAVNVPVIEGASPTIAVVIQHKSPTDETFSTLASFDTITTEGLYTKEATKIRQQARLLFTMSSGSWCCVQILPAQWSEDP